MTKVDAVRPIRPKEGASESSCHTDMVWLPGGTFCMVRNLSEQGAALDLPSLIAIPDDFTLVIPTEGARFFCQSVWRNERRIGVAFASVH